ANQPGRVSRWIEARNLSRNRADLASRDLVIRIYRSRGAIGRCRGRIVDRDQGAVCFRPAREVSGAHGGGRDGELAQPESLREAKPLINEEKVRLILAVVDLRQVNRASHRRAEI